MSFGQRLKLAIKYRGLTQKDVALAMQVTPQNLNQYIRGRRQPSKDFISKLAKTLEFEVRYTPEGEPFFDFPYDAFVDSERDHKQNYFSAQQIADALRDSSETIYFNELTGQIEVRTYEDMNRTLALKIQLDLPFLNVTGKISVTKFIDELLEKPEYNEKGMPSQKTPPQKQNITAPDELLAASQKLLKKYESLNKQGQEKLYDYSCDLFEIEKYRAKDLPRQETPPPEQSNTAPDTLLAAHQREDIEPTKEGIQQDLDIMNDESKWE